MTHRVVGHEEWVAARKDFLKPFIWSRFFLARESIGTDEHRTTTLRLVTDD